MQIHYKYRENYLQIAEIEKDVKSIDWVYDYRSQSNDFYAIQYDQEDIGNVNIVEVKIPADRKVRQTTSFKIKELE